jgi:hypothetical protein
LLGKPNARLSGRQNQVPLRYKKSPSGPHCCGDCCRPSRCRSGFELNARRRQAGEAGKSGEKAGPQVKAKDCAQGVEKEKTLNRAAALG